MRRGNGWKQVVLEAFMVLLLWVWVVVSAGVGSAIRGTGFVHGVRRLFEEPYVALFAVLVPLVWAVAVWLILRWLRGRMTIRRSSWQIEHGVFVGSWLLVMMLTMLVVERAVFEPAAGLREAILGLHPGAYALYFVAAGTSGVWIAWYGRVRR